MILSIEINNLLYKIDSENPIDISIPLDFNGAQPNAYNVEKATSKPCQAGSLIGDTRQGGSCNFEQITFIPHCNGTHTECVGHLTDERISVHDCLKDVFIPATLVSVKPENALETKETYAIELNENDKIITRESLKNALLNLETQNPKSQIPNPKSLVVRTLPND
jgi:arylformamidase